jgi:hypothetical protein
MGIPVECQRLRLGGSISGSTLSGGTLIETSGKNLFVHSTYLGIPGKKSGNLNTPSRDGQYARVGSASGPGKLYAQRNMTLSFIVYGLDDDGLVVTGDQCEEMEINLDEVKDLLSSEAEIILERDWSDGTTRWLRIEQIGEAFDTPGPVRYSKQLVVPVVAAYPFWQSETLYTGTITGTPLVIVNNGNAPIPNLSLSYAGDAVVTHAAYGAVLEVDGSAGTVIVDCGARTVTQSGSPADNLLIRNKPYWIRLPKAGGTLTRTGATVTVSWRDQWL